MVSVWNTEPKTTLYLWSNVYWYNGLLFVLVLNVFCIATQLALNLLSVCSDCRHPTPCRFQHHHSGSWATLKKIDYNTLVNPYLDSKSNNLFHTWCPSLSTLMTTNYVLPFLFSTCPYKTHFVYMWSHESDWKPVSAPPIPTGTTGHALSPRWVH